MNNGRPPHRGTADVVVVGAGIVGASAALELARAGLAVVVLERGAANREGSGTTAGNFHIQALPPHRHGRPRESARFLPLQRAASLIWDTLQDELETDFEYRRSGGIVVAETEAELEMLHAKHQLEADAGIASTLLDGAEARATLPLLGDTIIGGSVSPEDGYVNPMKLVPAYLEAAQRAGARVFSHARVTRIDRRDRAFRVCTVDETWTVSYVVDAAGPWLDAIARMVGADLELLPSAIQMYATTRTRPLMDVLVQHASQGLSVKQARAGNVLIGGGWPAASLDLDGRSPVSVTSMLRNLDLATRVLPVLGSLRILRAWAGPYSVTRDELPVIGGLSQMPGFLIAGGPHAFTLGPLWGKVVRDMVLGRRASVDLAGLGPVRLLRQPVAA